MGLSATWSWVWGQLGLYSEFQIEALSKINLFIQLIHIFTNLLGQRFFSAKETPVRLTYVYCQTTIFQHLGE